MNFGIAKFFGALDKSLQDKYNYLIDLLSKFTSDIETSSTASAILAKLLTVDGSTSGLDADLLDGKHYSEIFASPTFSGLVTTSGQIKFPATQNASTDVNTLDDYEEGTFEPTIYGTSTAGAATYTTRIGLYTKIGNVVKFNITMAWSAHSGTGDLRISGLPFALRSLTGYWEAYKVFMSGIALTSGYTPYAWNATGEQTIYLSQMNNATSPTNIPMDTAGTIVVSGEYFV